MTGRYEGQQPNTEQDGERLLRIMAMAAKAAGAQQAPADTRPAQANPGGMSEGDQMVSTARSGTGRDDAMQSLMQGDAGGSVPAGVAAETVNELKEVSGNRDVSQGGTTSGLTAASAIAALQEAGSKLSRDMLKSAYRAFAKECYLIIELMRQFYDEQRVYRITGESGGVEYATFSA